MLHRNKALNNSHTASADRRSVMAQFKRPSGLSTMLVAVMLVMSIVSRASSASSVAQCTSYSVDIIAGPDCSFLPSFAGARGIADNGSICGGYVDCSEVGHHVIWSANGEITEMPPSADGGIPDSPFDINSAQQVVGRMHVPSLSPPDRAFLYSKGVTINLGTLPEGNRSEALSINNTVTVCG